MRMPPLPADFIHARACKLKCEKILTRPIFVVSICNTNRYTFIVSKRHHQINALLRKKREPIFSNSHKTLGYLYFFSQNCVLEDAVCVILLRIQNGLTHKIVSQFIDVQKRRALWDLKHIGPLCIRSHSTNFR